MQTDQQLIARARQLLERGQLDEAEAAYARLAEQFPEQPGLHVMLGVCRKMLGNVDSAFEAFNTSLSIDRDFAEGHFHLGQLLHQLGRASEAEPALERAIVANPNHVGARVALARLLHRDNRSDQALEMLRSALRADQDSVIVRNELAQVLVDLGRAEEADEHASRAVRLQPEDPRAQIAMARVFQARRQWDFAEQCLKNALERAPDSSPLWAALGGLYQEAGRDSNAVAAFERAEQARRGAGLEPAVILTFAQSLQAIGRTGEARQRLEVLAGRYEIEGDALLMLAELRLAEDDAAGARSLLPKLGQSLPAAVKLIEAWLAEKGNDNETALRLAAELHEDDHSLIRRRARLISGRLALAARDAKSGQEALEPILEIEPTAAWLLAEIHRKAGDPEAARQILENHLTSSSEVSAGHRAMTRSRLAWLLDELEDHEAAATHLERTGWQGVPIQADLVWQMPELLHDSLMALTEQPWAPGQSGDNHPEPVFVLGWPGSGRESIVEALIESGLKPLPAKEVGRRRSAIGLPLAPSDLAAQTEATVSMARRRYFRGVDADQPFVLEPGWFEATALPALARFFPGACVVLPSAEIGDLELHWRLSGYGHIDDMLKLFDRDQQLLNQLRQWLPLKFVDVARSALTDCSGTTAEELAGTLKLGDPENLAGALEKALETYPIKPGGRWRNYADVLTCSRSPS